MLRQRGARIVGGHHRRRFHQFVHRHGFVFLQPDLRPAHRRGGSRAGHIVFQRDLPVIDRLHHQQQRHHLGDRGDGQAFVRIPLVQHLPAGDIHQCRSLAADFQRAAGRGGGDRFRPFLRFGFRDQRGNVFARILFGDDRRNILRQRSGDPRSQPRAAKQRRQHPFAFVHMAASCRFCSIYMRHREQKSPTSALRVFYQTASVEFVVSKAQAGNDFSKPAAGANLPLTKEPDEISTTRVLNLSF